MQKKVFALCWCAYAGGYLCRTNLSIVIPSLIQDLGWDKASIGLMGSLFFWTYAFGQLINGYIGDRVNPWIFIFISLFSSSLINIVLGFVFNRSLFIVLWAINGFLLSMLWGPIIRILGLWFLEWQRNKISSGISTSMFVSYLIYWSPIGRLIRMLTGDWHSIYLNISASFFLLLAKIYTFQTSRDRKKELTF